MDKFGRTHDIPNLFVCDGSILPTQGSANPGLTIQALAARTADYLISQGDAIFESNKRDLTEPILRRELAPPGTYGKGVPRRSSLTFRPATKVSLSPLHREPLPGKSRGIPHTREKPAMSGRSVAGPGKLKPLTPYSRPSWLAE